jgi:hypothetical protein
MIKATFIARTSDAFLLCEYYDKLISNYADIRAKSKKILGLEKSRQSDIEFVDLDSQTYIQ